MRQFYAHCVCVVGKNYRLQNIQLSKNRTTKTVVHLRASRYGATAAMAGRAETPQEAEAGGEYRARTGDLLVANQALSQLS
jgi:hypothetical protein